MRIEYIDFFYGVSHGGYNSTAISKSLKLFNHSRSGTGHRAYFIKDNSDLNLVIEGWQDIAHGIENEFTLGSLDNKILDITCKFEALSDKVAEDGYLEMSISGDNSQDILLQMYKKNNVKLDYDVKPDNTGEKYFNGYTLGQTWSKIRLYKNKRIDVYLSKSGKEHSLIFTAPLTNKFVEPLRLNFFFHSKADFDAKDLKGIFSDIKAEVVHEFKNKTTGKTFFAPTLVSAIESVDDGTEIEVPVGEYTIISGLKEIPKDIKLKFKSGSTIKIAPGSEGLYLGNRGEIVGVDGITVENGVVLYNTPSPREPKDGDKVIGLFADIPIALEKSKEGQTVVIGPGYYYDLGHVKSEGLIGPKADGEPNNPKKSAIVLLGYGKHRSETRPLSSEGTLLQNLTFKVNDELNWSDGNVAGIHGDGKVTIKNCYFENINSSAGRSTSMFNLGSENEPYNVDLTISDCTFKGFKNAIEAWGARTKDLSPTFKRTNFEKNKVDILFREDAKGICGIESNNINLVKIGDKEFDDDEIADKIKDVCDEVEPQNIATKDPLFVDPLAEDYRLTHISPFIDYTENGEDLGPFDSDLIIQLSNYLDGEFIFTSGDKIVLKDGICTENSFGNKAVIRSTVTANLRPIYEIIVRGNSIHNSAVMHLERNNKTAPVGVSGQFEVLTASYNGIPCGNLLFKDLPEYGTIKQVYITPDNVPPSRINNLTLDYESDKVSLSWDHSVESDLRRYKVYRISKSSPKNYVQIGSLIENYFTDAIVNAQDYVYTVVAYDNTGNHSEVITEPLHPIDVAVRDNSTDYASATHPQIVITNKSTNMDLKDFSVRVWFSKDEYTNGQLQTEMHWSDPSGITLSVHENPINKNIVYVEAQWPEGYILKPNESTPVDGCKFGVNFTGYWPGSWIKSNDWSMRDINGDWEYTRYITVYDKSGKLLFGKEPPIFPNQNSGGTTPNLKVEMYDDAYGINTVTRPRIKVTNISSDQTLSGFSVKLWLSKEEYVAQEVVVDKYYALPNNIHLEVRESVDNTNLVSVEIFFPEDYSLLPGESTNPAQLSFGIHFLNYWPGQWNKSNDYSYQGISDQLKETEYITVYNRDGTLLYGIEP